MSKNEIYYISGKLFKETELNTKILNLNRNFLRNLEFLAQFNKLEILDLSNNLIEYIWKKDFENLENLAKLYLMNNPVFFIESDSFHLLSNLLEIDLKNISSSLHPLNISLAKLIPNETFSVDLSQNIFYYFNFEGFLSFYYLKLSDSKCITNEILNFGKIYHLNILDISFSRLNFSNLDYFEFISLNLSNNYISSVDIIKRVQNLQYLNLSYNLIEKIEYNKIQRLKWLKELDLRHNLIETIEKDSFNLKNLETIYLDFNNLKIIDLQDFTATYLTFSFSNNNISAIKNYNFNGNLRRIVNLYFTNNLLSEFNLNIIYKDYVNLNELKNLILKNNQIKKLSWSDLSNLNNLNELDLSCNQLDSIDYNSFSSLETLEKLNLSSNKLSYLHKDTFRNLFQLKYLALSSNNIEYLDNDIFIDLFKLVDLDLSNNSIRFINNGLFLNLNQLQNLDLNINQNLTLSELCFNGLVLIKNIKIDFNVLKNDSNRINIVESLEMIIERNLNGVIYFISVNINYLENEIDCNTTLFYIGHKIHLKLKSTIEFNKFWEDCNRFVLKKFCINKKS